MFFIKEKALVGSCAICVKTVTHFSLFDTDLTHFLHYTALHFAFFVLIQKLHVYLCIFPILFVCFTYTTACMFAVFSTSSGCSVRILSTNQPHATDNDIALPEPADEALFIEHED